MQVRPVKTNSPTFNGYNCILKTLYKKGMLPEVKVGFYGDKLSVKNCSVEHIRCRADGGSNTLSNMVLASKAKNNARGNKPLKDFFSLDKMAAYLKQFIGIKRKGFDGDMYIKSVLQTVGSEL